MTFLDLTLSTPAENLACDEALLEQFEANGGGEVLRFWEPTERFVVVGYANSVGTEVNLSACEEGGVPVFRRCSGGGTVLQGRGCLNYTLVLKIEEGSPLQTIPGANRFIMDQNRAAIETLIPGATQVVTVAGHTDLAIEGFKFSGNAQRRKKSYLLFHGTFLLAFDLPLVEKFLRMPSKQPGYRGGRSHREFLRNLDLPGAAVKQALREAWRAGDRLPGVPRETIELLAREKYATDEWNLKF
jgi:lipoate-protein ligase A